LKVTGNSRVNKNVYIVVILKEKVYALEK